MCESGLRTISTSKTIPESLIIPLKINTCSDFYVLSRPSLSVEIRMSWGA